MSERVRFSRTVRGCAHPEKRWWSPGKRPRVRGGIWLLVRRRGDRVTHVGSAGDTAHQAGFLEVPFQGVALMV